MRALAFALVAALAGSAPGTTAAAPAPPAATFTHRVATARYYYVPGDSSVVPLPPLTVLAGDSLLHTNFDDDLHDLVSTSYRPDGRPWFDSELVGPGETAPVPVEGVPPGSYGFTCSIHPFMSGTLSVRSNPPPPEPQATAGDTEVAVGDPGSFEPKTLTIPVGATVLWRSEGQKSHTVTAGDGSWDSSPACPATDTCMAPGEIYTHTFNSAGTFPYYCKLHGTPSGGGHAGTIRVVAPGYLPTSVDSLSASATGSRLDVSGTATFQGEAPVTVAEDPSGDGPIAPGLADDTGVDLVGAVVHRPDPAIPSLFFEWRLTGLPSTGSLPEAVRYTLPFRIGTKQFQLQAKLTNLASITLLDDPTGHPMHLRTAFQLRGNCVPNYPQPPSPLGNCPHLAWLTGSFDVANKLVRIKVPLGVTPEFIPGASLQRNQNTNTSLVRIQATYQAVASSGTTTGDEAEWGTDDETFTYTIPNREVTLGIAPAGTPLGEVNYTGSANVGADGSFAGGIDTGGLATGSYDVWAKACFGANCGARKVTVTIAGP